MFLQGSMAVSLLARSLGLRVCGVSYDRILRCITGIYVWNDYAMGSVNIQVNYWHYSTIES
jgi:hypothetical protein